MLFMRLLGVTFVCIVILTTCAVLNDEDPKEYARDQRKIEDLKERTAAMIDVPAHQWSEYVRFNSATKCVMWWTNPRYAVISHDWKGLGFTIEGYRFSAKERYPLGTRLFYVIRDKKLCDGYSGQPNWSKPRDVIIPDKLKQLAIETKPNLPKGPAVRELRNSIAVQKKKYTFKF